MSLYPDDWFDMDLEGMIEEENSIDPSEVIGYEYDFLNYRVKIDTTGRVKKSDPESAYVFWVTKCILTERYSRSAYSSDYGVEIEAIVERQYPRPVTESELERTIDEALMVDPRTISTYDYEFEWGIETVTVFFTVNSVFGEIRINIERGGLD